MTGVGGRPEVIIEGSNSMDGPWEEYNFFYKPGNVARRLPFVGRNSLLHRLYVAVIIGEWRGSINQNDILNYL